MIEYKILSLETFMDLPEIKAYSNKNTFDIGDSDLSRSKGVVNFLQFMFDHMGRNGWEYVGITKAHSQRVDLYVKGRGVGSFLKGVVNEIGSKSGLNISNEGIIEAYIFVRKSQDLSVIVHANAPVVVEENNKPIEFAKVKKDDVSNYPVSNVEANELKKDPKRENFDKLRLEATQKLTSRGHAVSMQGDYPVNKWQINYKDGKTKRISSIEELVIASVEVGN
jgi:hypothetical protein